MTMPPRWGRSTGFHEPFAGQSIRRINCWPGTLCSRITPMICSSTNLDLFIVRLPPIGSDSNPSGGKSRGQVIGTDKRSPRQHEDFGTPANSKPRRVWTNSKPAA